MNKHTMITFLSIGILAMLFGGWLGSRFAPSSVAVPDNLAATLFPDGRPMPALNLIDHNQQVFNRKRLADKWSFMFFGFTHCPDICPDTLTVMQAVWQDISDNYPVQMLFVTVDPVRDTAKVMKDYVKYFHKDFIGITGELPEIDKLTRAVGILYGYEPLGEDKKNYGVNHSAQILLVDPEGKLRAIFSPPHEVDEITSQFKQIAELVKG